MRLYRILELNDVPLHLPLEACPGHGWVGILHQISVSCSVRILLMTPSPGIITMAGVMERPEFAGD